jgi:energy-coupling factor transporter ATP-binding protein EcfA2
MKEHITIIIGPNGRGKTVCLKFIEALFKKRYGYFAGVPFEYAEFSFTGGEKISLRRLESADPQYRDKSAKAIEFRLSAPNQEPTSWVPGMVKSSLVRELRRHIGESWQEAAPNLWIDRRDGEELDLDELADRHRLPRGLRDELRADVPAFYSNLTNTIDCQLIETERLLVVPSRDVGEEEGFGFVHGRRESRRSRLAITEKAEKLKSILKDTLSVYANLSQSLDRTFPLRVFDSESLSGDFMPDCRVF